MTSSTAPVDIPWLPSERVAQRPWEPPEQLRGLREREPLSRIRYAGGDVGWLVTSYALGRTVLEDPRLGVQADLIGNPIKGATVPEGPVVVPPGFITRADPPEHTRYRRNLIGQFTDRRMRQLSERIAEITADHIRVMREQGPPVDLVRAFAHPVPALMICELLGITDAQRTSFQAHVAAMRAPGASMDDLTAAYVAVHGLLHEVVVAKRADPVDDALSSLTTTTDLTDEELTNLAFTIMAAGLDTTANMISVGALALFDRPDGGAILRDDPDVAETAVEELLRYLAVLPLALRVALDDVELAGQTIRRGESVTVSLAAANRDPEHFDDPDLLDLNRDARSHLTFGHGIHKCLGQQLARAQLRIALPALFAAFPGLRLDGPVDSVMVRDEIALYGVHELLVTWD